MGIAVCIESLRVWVEGEDEKTGWYIYSGTSEQWTHWGQYKFTRFVPLVERLSSSQRYRKSKYLGPQATSLVERFIIHCPYLGGFTV